MMNLNLLILIVAAACLASTTTATAVPLVKPELARQRRVRGVKAVPTEERVLQGAKKDKHPKDAAKEFEMLEHKQMKAQEKAAKDAAIIAAGGALPPTPHAMGDPSGQLHPPPPPPPGGPTGDASDEMQAGGEVQANGEVLADGEVQAAGGGSGEVGQQEASSGQGEVAAAEAAQSAAAGGQYQGSVFTLLAGAALFSWSML